MSSPDEQMDSVGGISERELNLLTEVHRQPEASQRMLSQRVGISLGMTNLLLHNLAQKGLLRINKAGWRRFVYNLTPLGILHKIRLTLSYVERFLGHYRRVRQTLVDELREQSLNAESRVAIYGAGEFAELVYLGLKELGIDEVNVFIDDPGAGKKFLGMPVLGMSDFRPSHYDRVVVASMNGSGQQVHSLLATGVDAEKLVIFFNNHS